VYAIASRTGSNAKAIAQNFGAVYATTDYKEVLKDKNIDAVIIATRHNLHAAMAQEALDAGKAVFLEKPMALNTEEMKNVASAAERAKLPFLVGFNRRFSPCAREIKEHLSKRVGPMIANYRMNAGFIPLDRWEHTAEGGGRIVGEACHILDLFRYFTGVKPVSISVDHIKPGESQYSAEDNAVITVRYHGQQRASQGTLRDIL
jgi:predicted dehydrogenase